MADLLTFGGRLRDARREAGLSGQWVVDYLNGYLAGAGLQTVNLNTYYSWEKIETPGEIRRGKRYPHPMVYRNLIIAFGITGYWLWFGDMGGRIVRRRKDVPAIAGLDFAGVMEVEQGTVLKEEDEINREFRRVLSLATNTQKNALLQLLKAIR